MRRASISVTFQTLLIALLLLFSPPLAWGYRPFVSTDAAVADLKEMEIELGYFNLEREKGRNTLVVPKVVLNYGLILDMEIVGEFSIEEPPHGEVRLADPGLFLKTVLKEGVLQEKNGVSFAVEAGPLLPSTVKEERSFGFEGLGVVSGKLAALTYHVNLGGGVDRKGANPFALWGVIAEVPAIVPKLRLVGEVNGESVKGKSADNSVLFGFIWESPFPSVFIDGGIRKGLSREAPDLQITAGLTFSFSLASSASK